MPMIDDATWAIHQRALALLNRVADHPQLGTQFKRMAKQVDSTLRFQDIEAADAVQQPIMAELTKAQERIAKLESDREAERVQRETESHMRSLTGDMDTAAKKFGLTDEGVTAMKTRMTEKGSLDAEAAAAWVASQSPRAQPSEATGAFAPAALNLFGSSEKEERWEKLNTNPDAWMTEEIQRALAETPLAA
jgi:hypothetical protein